MKIEELIGKNFDTILQKWNQSIIDSYPQESGKYLLENKNKFSNPVGYTIENSLKPILEAVKDMSFDEKAKKSLDDIIRIRAVQDFSPSDALGFIKSLRAIIISELSSNIDYSPGKGDFLKLDRIFDEISSFSIDTYVDLRERIFRIKSNETRNGFERMIERLNGKYEDMNTGN